MEPVSCVTSHPLGCAIQSRTLLHGLLESAGQLPPSCLHAHGKPLLQRWWKVNLLSSGEKSENLKQMTNDIRDLSSMQFVSIDEVQATGIPVGEQLFQWYRCHRASIQSATDLPPGVVDKKRMRPSHWKNKCTKRTDRQTPLNTLPKWLPLVWLMTFMQQYQFAYQVLCCMHTENQLLLADDKEQF